MTFTEPFRAYTRVTFFERPKKVTKEVRPAACRRLAKRRSASRCPALLALSGAPRRQAIHGLAALDRHPCRSSLSEHCDARRHAGGMTIRSEARQRQKPRQRPIKAPPHQQRHGGLLILVLWLTLRLLWTLVPLKRAEHRRPWRIGSEGGEAGCRSLFAAPWMARRKAPSWPRSAGHRIALFASRDPTQRRGRAFFGYFLCAPKKVTRATARNGSVKPKESEMQATPNPSECATKPPSRSTRASVEGVQWSDWLGTHICESTVAAFCITHKKVRSTNCQFGAPGALQKRETTTERNPNGNPSCEDAIEKPTGCLNAKH